MTRVRQSIAEAVADVERLEAELAELEHARPRPTAKQRRHLRRAIARGRRRAQRMLDDAGVATA